MIYASLLHRAAGYVTLVAGYPRRLSTLDGPLVNFSRLVKLVDLTDSDTLLKQVNAEPYLPRDVDNDWWTAALGAAHLVAREGITRKQPTAIINSTLFAFGHERAILTISDTELDLVMADWLGRDDLDAVALMTAIHDARSTKPSHQVGAEGVPCDYPWTAEHRVEMSKVLGTEMCLHEKTSGIKLSYVRVAELFMAAGGLYSLLSAGHESVPLVRLQLALAAWEAGDLRMFEHIALPCGKAAQGKDWSRSRLPPRWLPLRNLMETGQLHPALPKMEELVKALTPAREEMS